MRAFRYTPVEGSPAGGLVQREVPEPGPGEVRVKVVFSGVNPVDWKTRNRAEEPYVPNHDGAGQIDKVGPGVDSSRVGRRVWVWAANAGRTEGTAQEYVTVPEALATELAEHASYEDGAALGVPALTAHRCLTINEGYPAKLGPGALRGRTVLVTGGAGAVGNAAIQLARWAGAQVVTTVSGPEKAALAQAAGAHHIINYRTQDVAGELRTLVPEGIDTLVDVAAKDNAALALEVLKDNGAVAAYAGVDGDNLVLPVREVMAPNLRWQGVFLYRAPQEAKENAVAAVAAALEQRAFGTGEARGLPILRYPLADLGKAHDDLEAGQITGKVLIEI